MNDTRVFTATYSLTLDGAVLEVITHTLTVTGDTRRPESLTFTLDGQPCTLEEAARVTALALAANGWTKVSQPAPIGKARACEMHKALARNGYPTNHYDLASGVLGREVVSFAALTEAEARTVWTCLIHGAGVAA